MAESASAGNDEASLSSLKESYAAEKAGLERSLAAFEKKLENSEYGIHEFAHTRDTIDELATNVNEAKAKLRSSEEHVQFLEDKLSEQSAQLVEKDISSRGYRARVVVIEEKLATRSAESERLNAQHVVTEDLVKGARPALALHKAASQ